MSVRAELAKSLDQRQKRVKGRLKRTLNLRGNSADLAIYAQMREDNLGAADFYGPGRFWGEINNEFADFLWAGALATLRTEYLNRRFAGPDPCSRQVWRALLWVYYQKLQEIDTDGFLRSASEPRAGGDGDQDLIDGRPMSLDFLQSVEEVYRLREAWTLAGRPGPPRLIVELGAGYGRLANVCRRMLPDCTYVILDLPEALLCSSHWLQQVLSSDCVPYEESRKLTSLSRETLLSRKVWTLAAHQIEALADRSVDVFVNIYSFAEMPKRAIDNYFSQLSRVTEGVLYSKQRKVEKNRVDGIEVTTATYPIRSSWKLLFERNTILYEAFFEAAYAVRRSV